MCIPTHNYQVACPHRMKAFEEALDYITGHPDVWVATGREIAEYYLAHYHDEAKAAIDRHTIHNLCALQWQQRDHHIAVDAFKQQVTDVNIGSELKGVLTTIDRTHHRSISCSRLINPDFVGALAAGSGLQNGSGVGVGLLN